MAAVMEVLLILTLASVLAFATAALVCYLVYAVPVAWSRSWDSVAEGFSRWEAKADADERRARIEEQMNHRNRTGSSNRDVDATFVQAAEMSKRISSAVALVKDATKTCCEIHKFTAQVRGVTDMEEVAWDPVCSNLRRYVLDGIDVVLKALGSYPLMDRKILKQHIGLGTIRERCEDCELLKYAVAEAPPLCSPARSLGNRPDDEKE